MGCGDDSGQAKTRGRGVISFFVPVRTVNDLNNRQHWRVVHKRAKEQRNVARLVADASGKPPEPPLLVTMTRVGDRRMDTGDNLAGSMKHVRDAIADWLGIDDGRDDLVTWAYDQRLRGKRTNPVGVDVTVQPRPDDACPRCGYMETE